MKIGFIGLGKLGLPCALAIESSGHQVAGWDINPDIARYLTERKVPYKEEGIQKLLDETCIRLETVSKIVDWAEIIFVAVQTPHAREFEGDNRLPKKRRDFDYAYLKASIKELAILAQERKKEPIVAIISTVLPGTMDEQIIPIVHKYGGHLKLVYNPFFIAMGTTIHDFLNPEFVLLGVENQAAASRLSHFYLTILGDRYKGFNCSIRSAEAIKVLYNTYITQKIVFANAAMELCFHTGADVDNVTDCLAMGTDRIISSKYMYAGMGDGGGCHPRDNIALSFIARKYGINFDLWENLMIGREKQTEFLVEIILSYWNHEGYDLTGIYILGKSFKPETNLTVGSPATLLYNMLIEKVDPLHVDWYDPHVDELNVTYVEKEGHDKSKDFFILSGISTPILFFIATKHPEFKQFMFPPGSIVIDPWRYIPDQKDVIVIRLGKGS